MTEKTTETEPIEEEIVDFIPPIVDKYPNAVKFATPELEEENRQNEFNKAVNEGVIFL